VSLKEETESAETNHIPQMSAEEVAAAFVNHFYSTFNANVEALAGLYVRFAVWSPIRESFSLFSFTHFYSPLNSPLHPC